MSLIGAVVGMLLAPAGPALATPVTETPANDDVVSAFGPLSAGDTYTGQFETIGDTDWLYFYAEPGKTVQVQVTKVGVGCGNDIGADLLDPNGSNSLTSTTRDEPAYLTVTARARERIYLALRNKSCVGDPYKVIIGPSDAIVTVPPPGEEPPVAAPQPLPEPNGGVADASGPLASGTAYGGDFSSANDQDWLVFYTPGPVVARVLVTKVGAGCSPEIVAAVRAASGQILVQLPHVGSNRIVRFDFTATAAGRFYVALGSASECVGDPYQVRVGPPDAITVSSPLMAFAPTATPVATGEPNDTPAQATRVMGGTGYGAGIDTFADLDFFRFFAVAGSSVDVSITKVDSGCGADLDSSVVKAATPEIPFSGNRKVGRHGTVHHEFTSEATTEYLVRVSGTCDGDAYQLRVDPASAIVGPPPPDGDGDGRPDDQDRCPTVAAASANGCPRKVKPTAMTLVLLPRSDSSRPFRFRVAGSIRLPDGLPAGAACRGKVAIRFRAGGRSVAFATAALRPNCKYGRTFAFGNRRSFARARRLRVMATFRGNALLRSTSRISAVRVR